MNGKLKQRKPAGNAKQPIHFNGSVSYEFQYRSRVDTPFLQQDFQQHIIRTVFRTDIIKSYPVMVNMAYRSSNSPYLRNTLDVNVGYDLHMFRKQLEDKVIALARQKMMDCLHLGELEKKYQQTMKDAAYWSQLVSNPDFSFIKQKAASELTERILTGISKEDSVILQATDKIRPIILDYQKQNTRF